MKPGQKDNEVLYEWEEMPEVFYERQVTGGYCVVRAVSIRGEKWSANPKDDDEQQQGKS